MARLASTVNEPTLATTPFSTAWRAQLAAFGGVGLVVADVDLERAAVDAAPGR